MAIPAPAVMAAAKPAASLSSGFLTSIGSGLGSALGSLFGSSGGSGQRRAREARLAYENQLRYLPRIESAQFKQRMRDLDEAGLHRLAGLGISMGGSAQAMPPMVPGQSKSGSAIGEGIRAFQASQQSQKASAHQKTMAAMAIEEQKLRNDWLRQQIINSKAKTLEQVTNASQGLPLSVLTEPDKPPHKGDIVVRPAQPYEHSSGSQGYNVFGWQIRQRPGKLTGQGAEDALGEFGSAIYSPFSIAQDIGYTLDRAIRRAIPRYSGSPETDFGPSP